jgi:hypothetical protein
VTQAAASCSFTLTPTSASFATGGGSSTSRSARRRAARGRRPAVRRGWWWSAGPRERAPARSATRWRRTPQARAAVRPSR